MPFLITIMLSSQISFSRSKAKLSNKCKKPIVMKHNKVSASHRLNTSSLAGST